MKHIIQAIGLIFCLLLIGVSLSAQGIYTEFGQNRIQYEKFKWKKYISPNFITYWYDGGEEISRFVIHSAEKDYEQLQSTMEYKIGPKIRIIVFTSITDFQQANIGDTELFYNVGSVVKTLGNKIYVYYDGDHHKLYKQIREGIAQVYVNQMLLGHNFQEIVQNAVCLLYTSPSPRDS